MDAVGEAAREVGQGAVQASAAEPTQAFEPWFRSAWPGAVRLAALVAQDASVAEEAAQEAMARVLERWVSVRDPDAYLYRCVVNAVRTHYRRAGVARTKQPLLIAPGEAVEPAETAISLGGLADAVAALPFRQRAVIVLRYHYDLSEREIADALGCRPGTVKSLASRALAALHAGLKEGPT